MRQAVSGRLADSIDAGPRRIRAAASSRHSSNASRSTPSFLHTSLRRSPITPCSSRHWSNSQSGFVFGSVGSQMSPPGTAVAVSVRSRSNGEPAIVSPRPDAHDVDAGKVQVVGGSELQHCVHREPHRIRTPIWPGDLRPHGCPAPDRNLVLGERRAQAKDRPDVVARLRREGRERQARIGVRYELVGQHGAFRVVVRRVLSARCGWRGSDSGRPTGGRASTPRTTAPGGFPPDRREGPAARTVERRVTADVEAAVRSTRSRGRGDDGTVRSFQLEVNHLRIRAEDDEIHPVVRFGHPERDAVSRGDIEHTRRVCGNFAS